MSQASGLPYTVAIQDDFILNSAMGSITVSSAQVVQQRYPANSQSLNQVQFQNIKLSGAQSLFDSQFLLEYQITVQADLKQGELLPGLLFSHNATIGGCTVAIDNQTFPILSNAAGQIWSTNIGNLAFRELPLSRNTSSLQVALNNANQQNYSLQQQLALVDPLTEEDKKRLNGLTPVDSPRGVVIPNFYDLNVPAGASTASALTLTIDPNYKGGRNQPNNPFWNDGRNFIRVVSISAPANGVYSATYLIREPVLASPFTVGYSGCAIGNLDSISITYNIDSSTSLKGMFVATKDYLDGTANPPLLTALSVSSITGCTLITSTYSVDPSVVDIPPVIYYDFSQFVFNSTPGVSVPSAGSSATKQTQSIALNTVPKMYVAKIQPLPNGLGGNTAQQIGATVQNLTVNYGSLGRFVFTQEQLYQAFVRNSKTLKSFNEWVDDCVIMLDPALDFQNSASSFTGVANMGTLTFNCQYQYTCDNYLYGGLSVPGDLNINEMFINQGSLAIGSGQATYTTTTISSGQLVAALDKPLVSHKVLHSSASGNRVLRGGGIFSSLGNVLRGAVGSIPSVLNTAGQAIGMAQGAMSHPLVQSALGALSGSGMRRRR
jgi:hypothetical protein